MIAFDAAQLALLVGTVVKLTSFVKYLTAGYFRAAVTQILVWTAGIFVVWLATGAFNIAANGQAIVLTGIGIASGASVVYDFKKARDGGDSAAEPALGGGA